jgi:hypothetical protein
MDKNTNKEKNVFWKHYFYTHPQTYTHNWTEGKHLKSGKKNCSENFVLLGTLFSHPTKLLLAHS